MAVTGKSYVPITGGTVGAGVPEVVYVAENSSVTATKGAPVTISSGYATQCSANPATVYGFLETAGANNAAQGTSKSRIIRAKAGARYVGTLKATLTQAMIGSVANLVAGSSTWYLDTSTSVSSAAQVQVEAPAEGFAIGDTQPLVYFTFISDAFIE